MQTIIIRTLEELRVLKDRWSSKTMSTPFASWEFVHEWLERYDAKPFVIVVTDDAGHWLALAPWCILRGPGGLRILTGVGGYDAGYHDPVSWASGEAIVSNLIESLQRYRRDWDLLKFNLHSDVKVPLLHQLQRLGWVIAEQEEDRQNAVIEIGESWEAYWNGRSKEFRKSMRRLHRKLSELPHCFEVATPATLDRLLDELFRLNSERWGDERNWEPYYDFLRAYSHQALLRQGIVLNALTIGDRVVAVDLIMRSQEYAYCIMGTYHPDFAHLSVGHLLANWTMEQMHRSGVTRIDLGAGNYDYKARLKTGNSSTLMVHVPTRLPGFLFVVLLEMRRQGRAILAGLKDRLPRSLLRQKVFQVSKAGLPG